MARPEVVTPLPVVLIIEDEPHMRRFLRASLRANGFQVIEAATAREGLAQAAGRNPEVILLDLGFPMETDATSPVSFGAPPAHRSSCSRRAGRSMTR